MSDDPKSTGTETEPAASDPITLPDDHPLVKSLAAMKEQIKELKASNAANADKAKKLDELEEASKTELEKAIARAEAAEQKIAAHEAAAEQAKVRDSVAKAKGIPASLLRGSTKDDFEAHADELIAAGLKPAAGPSSKGQGATGEVVASTDDRSAAETVSAALGR